MHAGAKLLEIKRLTNGEWIIDILAKFVEHESMNYASGGRPRKGLLGKVDSFVVVSTSFYDKKLCVWEHVVNDLGILY